MLIIGFLLFLRRNEHRLEEESRNWAVAEWKRQYEAGEKPSALKLRTQFHALRKAQLPWTYDVTKCAIEGAFMDVAAAFKNFFEGRKAGRKTGYPKFKSKKRSRQ